MYGTLLASSVAVWIAWLALAIGEREFELA
jgi:hypothetical protein